MGAIGTVSLDDPPAPAEDRRKKKRYAYPAWLCLGSHYLYLGRPFTQLFFWLTLGGLLLWWLIDFFRLPAMIEKQNRRETEKMIAAYEESLQQRLVHLETLNRPAWKPAPALPVVESQPAWGQFEAPAYQDAAVDEGLSLKGRRNAAPALALTSALGAAVALYIFNPPPLFPYADASFRAVRQVNVRISPSTASPIRAVAAKETVLSGTVVEASGGTAKWLKIGRGSHSGGYVAVQNLESL
jgi:TM2 domain-containing membrane protein YozV